MAGPVLQLGAVEPREAFAAFARRKALAPSFRWQDVWAHQHTRAFAVAAVLQTDVLQTFHDAIEQAVASGQSLEAFREGLRSQLVARGFWGDVTVTDPATGEQRVSRFNDNRLRLIYDVNLRVSHAAGRWARIEANQAQFPLVLYRTMQDERVRLLHQQWNGLVLPVGDDWWRTHYPPNGWRCRCMAFATNERDLARRVAAGEKISRQAPPVQWVDYRNPHTDEVKATPLGVDPGFGHNPGLQRRAWQADTLGQVGQAMARTPAPLGAAVAAGAPALARQAVADGFAAWLAQVGVSDATAAAQQYAGALTAPAIRALASAGTPPASAAVMVSAGRVAGGAFTTAQWAQLPQALAGSLTRELWADLLDGTVVITWPPAEGAATIATTRLAARLAVPATDPAATQAGATAQVRQTWLTDLSAFEDATRWRRLKG